MSGAQPCKQTSKLELKSVRGDLVGTAATVAVSLVVGCAQRISEPREDSNGHRRLPGVLRFDAERLGNRERHEAGMAEAKPSGEDVLSVVQLPGPRALRSRSILKEVSRSSIGVIAVGGIPVAPYRLVLGEVRRIPVISCSSGFFQTGRSQPNAGWQTFNHGLVRDSPANYDRAGARETRSCMITRPPDLAPAGAEGAPRHHPSRVPIADSSMGPQTCNQHIGSDAGTKEGESVIKKLTMLVLAVMMHALARADDYSDAIDVFKKAGESAAFFKDSYGTRSSLRSPKAAWGSEPRTAKAEFTKRASTSATPQ